MEFLPRPITRLTSDAAYWQARFEVEAVLFSGSTDAANRLWADLMLPLIEHYETTHPDLDYGESVPLVAFIKELIAMCDELPEGIEDPWQYVLDNPEE